MNLEKYNSQLAVSPVGFRNTGVICYFNSVLQSLLSCTSFISKIKEEKLKHPSNTTLAEFNKLIDLYESLRNNENKKDINNLIISKIQQMSVSLWRSMAIANKQKNNNFSFNGQQCGVCFSYFFGSAEKKSEKNIIVYNCLYLFHLIFH